MTLRNKIGQLLVVGFNGCDLDESSELAQSLSQDGLGGVLLFDKDLASGSYGKNLKSQWQIKQLIRQLNHFAALCPSYKDTMPLLTAIDYEGGAVDRLTHVNGCMPTLKATDLIKLIPDAFDDEVGQMAMTLKDLGFNLNFAPVVDLNLNSHNGIIGKLERSFSDNPEVVARVARRFVEAFNRQGIACAYKHFPGHGSAVGDTHEGFVDVTDTFTPAELLPYHNLLKDNDNLLMVMTAHVVNKNLDSSGLPATLSHEILTGLLRETIGYDGVIISDDLQMQAIANHYSLDEALCLTLNAGADMMIFANQLGDNSPKQLIDRIEFLVLSGQIDSQRIDEAYGRVLRLKQQINAVSGAAINIFS